MKHCKRMRVAKVNSACPDVWADQFGSMPVLGGPVDAEARSPDKNRTEQNRILLDINYTISLS